MDEPYNSEKAEARIFIGDGQEVRLSLRAQIERPDSFHRGAASHLL